MDEDSKGYRAIRIGDPSDWRLVTVISEQGMEAYLRNVEDPMSPVETLLRTEWDLRDRNLLEHVENAVYAHPQLLDDFTTDIAIVTSKALWAPEEVVDGEDDPGDEIFRTVYEASEEDIMRDYQDGRVCIYTLAPGLRPFLQRTFPGARLHCHQSVMVKRFGERGGDLPRVYVDIRRGMADFVAFDGSRLLIAVTHEWHDLEDIRYWLFNLLEVYGLDPKAVHVSLSGLRKEKGELIARLRENVAYVMMTMVPSVGTAEGMSLTASLLMRNGN